MTKKVLKIFGEIFLFELNSFKLVFNLDFIQLFATKI